MNFVHVSQLLLLIDYERDKRRCAEDFHCRPFEAAQYAVRLKQRRVHDACVTCRRVVQ